MGDCVKRPICCERVDIKLRCLLTICRSCRRSASSAEYHVPRRSRPAGYLPSSTPRAIAYSQLGIMNSVCFRYESGIVYILFVFLLSQIVFLRKTQGDLRKTVYKMIRIVYNIPTAMKSGLKDKGIVLRNDYITRYTPYRDEKRTESLYRSILLVYLTRSCTPYRDEKRTERIKLGRHNAIIRHVALPTAMKSGLKESKSNRISPFIKCCTPYRDEKRTESVPLPFAFIFAADVALPTAMKSGLKATEQNIWEPCRDDVALPTAMKSGLKAFTKTMHDGKAT